MRHRRNTRSLLENRSGLLFLICIVTIAAGLLLYFSKATSSEYLILGILMFPLGFALLGIQSGALVLWGGWLFYAACIATIVGSKHTKVLMAHSTGFGLELTQSMIEFTKANNSNEVIESLTASRPVLPPFGRLARVAPRRGVGDLGR